MKKRSHAYAGKAAEYKVVCALLERGFNVWFAALEATSIDLICTKGSNPPIRLQVKSTKALQSNAYRFCIDGKRSPLKGEADFFVLVTPDHMLVRPARAIENVTTLRLHINKFHDPQWHLLEEFKCKKSSR